MFDRKQDSRHFFAGSAFSSAEARIGTNGLLGDALSGRDNRLARSVGMIGFRSRFQ